MEFWLPLELFRAAGPKRPHLGVCPGPNFPLQGRQGSRGLVKAMVFPVVMYGWESWTVKKAEHRRIDIFELWCWRSIPLAEIFS